MKLIWYEMTIWWYEIIPFLDRVWWHTIWYEFFECFFLMKVVPEGTFLILSKSGIEHAEETFLRARVGGVCEQRSQHKSKVRKVSRVAPPPLRQRKICHQLTNRPHKLWPCFQVPTDSRGLWGAHEQYLSNPWAPLHADLCMWKPERRSFTHSRSHARSLEVRFFLIQSETSRPYMRGGGRTDTTNRLSENHL